MAIPDRQQCEHCGASMTNAVAYQKHMADHQPGGQMAGGQIASGPEDRTKAAEDGREALLDHTQTPGEAERKHDEARR